MEFDEKYGSSFITKKLDRTHEYALTFLRRNLTHIFRLGSHFLMHYPGSMYFLFTMVPPLHKEEE